MADDRTPPERQVQLWLSLWRQWPDSDWGEQCLAEAERIAALLRREKALRNEFATPSATVQQASRLAESPRATHHFVWLGDRRGLQVEQLRAGISSLAQGGMIATAREQQDALRRGLGLTVNEEERRTDAPWVHWLGPTDMLWLLVDGLWERQLITCAGGRGQKWHTATGIFRRADSTSYGSNLRNSRCQNKEKVDFMRQAILDPLCILDSAH